MITMHPVVILGYHLNDWVPERLPLSIFEARLGAVRQQMRLRGWQGLIVHGDAQQSGLLAWLTNFCPRLRWGLSLIGPEDEPQLLVAASTRDLPATRQLTWCKSVDVYSNAAQLLPEWMQQLRSAGAPSGATRVAVYGLSRMRNSVRRMLDQTVGRDAELCDADAVLDAIMQPKQAYELDVMRQAYAMLAQTAEELRQAWRDGKPVCDAVLQAELYARRSQVQDVRILFSVDGGRTLRPFERVDAVQSDTLVCYLAVRHRGYWAETFVSCGVQDTAMAKAAADILTTFVKTAVPGMKGGDLFNAARPYLAGAFKWHPMLEGRCGNGVGLTLDERPHLSPDSEGAMEVGGVYSLHAGLANGAGEGVLISATVHFSSIGTERLDTVSCGGEG
jgi:Xaa-Pro aminopeptidase